jgi:hypothetical protein
VVPARSCVRPPARFGGLGLRVAITIARDVRQRAISPHFGDCPACSPHLVLPVKSRTVRIYMLRSSRRLLNTSFRAAQQCLTSTTTNSTSNNSAALLRGASTVAAAAALYCAASESSSNCASLWGSTEDSPKPGIATVAPSKSKVVFVLGGPGAGKGTQCAKIVEVCARILFYDFTRLLTFECRSMGLCTYAREICFVQSEKTVRRYR